MTKRLVALRPNSTVNFELEGITFKVGVLPRVIFGEFMDAASAQATGDMKTSEFLELQRKVVKFAVKGHDNFCYEDGEPVPFETETTKVLGNEIEVVSEETLDIYYGVGAISPVALKAINMKGGEEVKKKKAKA